MLKTDKQTLTDLNVLDWNSASLLRYFDRTLTLGGQDELYNYLKHPLASIDAIIERQQAIAYLGTVHITDLFDKHMMADLERYLRKPIEPRASHPLADLTKGESFLFFSLSAKRERLFIYQSVREIAMLFTALEGIIDAAMSSGKAIGLLRKYADFFSANASFFDAEELRRMGSGKKSRRSTLRHNYLFRGPHKNRVRELFDMLYTIDALVAVAKMWNENSLCFPKMNTDETPASLLDIVGLYNLALHKPIKNDLHITTGKNIWFLTGANMTGKSTLLKSIGICIYLAHVGFPVPAESMEILFYNGLMTSINLVDDIGSGYSHFYAEVRRLKAMGEHMALHSPSVIMLDEIFKGTNYQDAFEATLNFINSISGIERSLFFISTHITDVGERIANNKHVALKHLETLADVEQGARFTYKLIDGVATEKLGMWFLNRESVFDTFRAIKPSPKDDPS